MCVLSIIIPASATLFSIAASETESVSSTCAECDNTAGIIAGVVVVAVALITALTVIVVVLVLKSRRQPTTK